MLYLKWTVFEVYFNIATNDRGCNKELPRCWLVGFGMYQKVCGTSLTVLIDSNETEVMCD